MCTQGRARTRAVATDLTECLIQSVCRSVDAVALAGIKVVLHCCSDISHDTSAILQGKRTCVRATVGGVSFIVSCMFELLMLLTHNGNVRKRRTTMNVRARSTRKPRRQPTQAKREEERDDEDEDEDDDEEDEEEETEGINRVAVVARRVDDDEEENGDEVVDDDEEDADEKEDECKDEDEEGDENEDERVAGSVALTHLSLS